MSTSENPTVSLDAARRRAAIAGILGLPEEQIGIETVGTNLMQDGTVVAVKLSRWRAKTGLDLDDLGLPPMDDTDAEVIRGIFRLGEKRLLPNSYFNRLTALERTVYRTLEKHSFESPWGRFVPATAFPAWKDAHAQAVGDYLEVRDEIVRDYDQIMALLRRDYAVAARQAYRVLNRGTGDAEAEERFIAAMWARIRAAIPRAAEIGASFTVSVEYAMIPLPSQLALGDKAPAQVEALRHQVSAAAEAAARRRKLVEEMNREVLAAARAKKEAQIDGFLAGLVTQLRTLIYDVSLDTLTSLEGKDAPHSRSLAALKELVGKVERLNFFGDAEATRMVAQVQAILDTPAKERTPEEIQRVLRSVGTVARSSLLAIGEQPRSGREVGIADAPSMAEVRSARADIGVAVAARPSAARSDRADIGHAEGGVPEEGRRPRSLELDLLAGEQPTPRRERRAI